MPGDAIRCEFSRRRFDDILDLARVRGGHDDVLGSQDPPQPFVPQDLQEPLSLSGTIQVDFVQDENDRFVGFRQSDRVPNAQSP